MNVTVDQELCIGCAACEGTCPEVFELKDDKSQVILSPVPEALRSSAMDAEEACPVGAISHEG